MQGSRGNSCWRINKKKKRGNSEHVYSAHTREEAFLKSATRARPHKTGLFKRGGGGMFVSLPAVYPNVPALFLLSTLVRSLLTPLLAVSTLTAVLLQSCSFLSIVARRNFYNGTNQPLHYFEFYKRVEKCLIERKLRCNVTTRSLDCGPI